ncbi:uncharacterized protein LOC132800773 [Ziziphus jujuba]|uniref:Uncharacterized protein LOC132800773 n=1 Tax=Ziziphus jujuba TaxID=326968 RepID=A0ABM4A2S3_ZIZJJ|nr:uncharacterized protein LOC132800773 [Ziziphus jujuba]
MKDGESVTSYCSKTMGIANKMRFHGEKMEDVVIVEKILFHEQKINHSTTIDEQDLKASTYAQSFNLKGRGRGRGRGRGGQSNRDGSRQYSEATDDQSVVYGRGRGCEFDKSKIKCYRCNKFGHYCSGCYTRLLVDTEKREKSNFAENEETEETLLVANHVKKKLEPNVWYVDTGCSNHICGSKSSFSSLNENFHTTVSFGDCSTMNVMGKGDIKIKTKNGFEEIISQVFYGPEKGYVLVSYKKRVM